MAKHVRVDGEWHLGGLAETLDEPVETDGADYAALGNEYRGRLSGNRGVACAAPASRHPGLGGRWGFHSSPGERAGGPRRVRSGAIAGRTPRRPADRGDRRPGSWSHPAPVAAVLAGAVHQPLN